VEAAPTPIPRLENHAGLVWRLADLLRGDYKQSEYGRVILPLVVLRRLDCVLEPTKQQVIPPNPPKSRGPNLPLAAFGGFGIRRLL
jgi:hypothetical protein